MKELSIDEKAEAYDKALERVKDFIEKQNPPAFDKNLIGTIFPELKESEEEKTRKRIIALVNAHGQGMYKDDMLAWLENIPYTIDHEKREGFHLGYKAGLEKKGEQNTNHKTMIVKFICKKDWHGIGDYYYGKIYNGYPCEKEQEGYDIYDDNHIPTFCNKEFIDEYFNIITEEKQGEQKPNPCDGCINRKGCINCENGELREAEQKPADKDVKNVDVEFKKF